MRSKPSNLRAETDTTGHGQRARADHAVAVKSLRCTGSASAKHSKSGTPRGPSAARTSHGVARDRARGNTTRFRARSGTPTCARRHAHADMRTPTCAHADMRAREVAGERGCMPGRWCTNYKHPRTRRTKTLGMKCSIWVTTHGTRARARGTAAQHTGRRTSCCYWRSMPRPGVALGRRDWPAGEDGSGGDRHVARNQR